MKDSFKFLMLLFLSLNILIISGCGKDEEPSCTNFPLLSGSMDINGENVSVSAFQVISSAGGTGFGDSYSFQVAGISNDCNTQTSFNLNYVVPSGSSASGTFEIKEFFNADDDDASGVVITQTVDPITQSSMDMVAGTLTVNDKGDNQYDLDVTATLVGGAMVTMSIVR